MLGFDILDRDTGQPNGAAARAVCARALEQGLLLLNCGVSGEAIRILVPLTAPDAVLDEGLDILDRALASDGVAACPRWRNGPHRWRLRGSRSCDPICCALGR